MPKASRYVLATDREVQNSKPKGERAEFRIKGAATRAARLSQRHERLALPERDPVERAATKASIRHLPGNGLVRGQKRSSEAHARRAARTRPLAEWRTEQAADTFEELAGAYVHEHELKYARGGTQSGWTAEVSRLLNADILPAIGSLKAELVTKRHVMAVVETVAKREAYVTADRVLGIIRSIYNWAAGTGRVEVNPTFGLKKRNTGRPRQRVLSDGEIRSLWHGLDANSGLSDQIRDSLKLQLVFGLRRSETLGAAKDEIDLEGRVWTIPADRTKAHREHRLPLPALAVSILRAAIDRSGDSPWLFPSAVNDAPMRARSASRALLRMRAGMNLDDVGTHDLRRTLATGLGNMGVADPVIERVLNHAPRTVDRQTLQSREALRTDAVRARSMGGAGSAHRRRPTGGNKYVAPPPERRCSMTFRPAWTILSITRGNSSRHNDRRD